VKNGDSARRGRRFLIPYLLLAVLVLGSVAVAWASSRTLNTTIGPEGVVVYDVPNLAPASTTHTGQIVDGITCRTEAKEVVKYHVHVHVALYADGRMVRLPAGIGVTQPPLIEKYTTGKFYDVGLYDCLYWLHTHVADGIIHVEAPAKQSFTLGQFFDIWNQPLSDSQVGPAKGSVVVFENGKKLIGDPRQTPLLPHGDIQIDVGTPIVPFQPFAYKVTGSCGEGTNSCSTPKS
jgi:hypothetical protein